jgi:ferredoxin--NADP+ reductase
MYTCSEATRPLGIKTIVSLNPIMLDGTGMCGACRVSVDESTKFACVDGPDFDGHLVDWQELFSRRKSYFDDEIQSLCYWEKENFPKS